MTSFALLAPTALATRD